jgi:protein-S-isoprenylcysteine O-methyltransferase Ste14
VSEQEEVIMEDIWSHYHQWWAAALFAVIGLVFLAFVPFYRKSQRKPAGAYTAFVLAFALEMFGVPASMYVVTWIFGRRLPEGVLWGHTLSQWIGNWGMYVGVAFMLVGVSIVVVGWRTIFRRYWSQEEGKGELVTTGIYSVIRHPQYTGFELITLGMLCEWATIPLLVMWPILGILYYRLARREENEMEQEFGDSYRLYKAETSMFLPIRWLKGRFVSLHPRVSAS